VLHTHTTAHAHHTRRHTAVRTAARAAQSDEEDEPCEVCGEVERAAPPEPAPATAAPGRGRRRAAAAAPAPAREEEAGDGGSSEAEALAPMLECGGCLRGYHLTCLDPPLAAVPKARRRRGHRAASATERRQGVDSTLKWRDRAPPSPSLPSGHCTARIARLARPGAACRPAARGGGRPHACGGAPEAGPRVAAWGQDRARAQGDWLCPACAAGAPPAPRPRPLTAVEKLLCGRLGLARVEGFWRRGAGPAMVDLRFFLRPEELHTGRLARPARARACLITSGAWVRAVAGDLFLVLRLKRRCLPGSIVSLTLGLRGAQRHHGAREVFLGRTTGVAEAACLLRPAPVVSRRAFAEAPPASNDVLTCDYLYDEAAQARAAPGTDAAGAPPGARRPPSSSS